MSEVKLEYDGQTYSFPIVVGTENEKAIDISKLRASTGLVTLDNGYVNTGSCQSKITFLNGEQGILRYRGYSIEELCEKSSFVEVMYLLINGELPTETQLSTFRTDLRGGDNLSNDVRKFYSLYPKDAHPMGIVSATLSTLSTFHQDLTPGNLSADQKSKVMSLLLGYMKSICAYAYRSNTGKAFVDANPDLNYVEDFLSLMFADDKGQYEVDPEIAQAIDLLLILHADHEQNCSASTVRLVGSSQANLFATISAGVDALWGQLHGGANQAVIEMLEEIQKDGGGYKKFLDKAKDKNDPFRIMGFGHRVYKNFDPRAKIIKKACDSVLSKLGVNDPALEIAKGLEEAALTDDYFVERKLYPNVDFYSGIIYRAIGIPTNMFTVMFALGRLPGWISQWKEMIEDPTSRIGRPRQIYMGETARAYTPIGQR
ncbi:MAG: citrate synthase [Bdellovibrionales bacterium]|nr:citrate synthase [Bdellovibrionales bacterium]